MNLNDNKKKIKSLVENLINKGSLKEVKKILSENKDIFKDDPDFNSIMGTIYFYENDFSRAMDILKDGLLIDYYNIDINYNLGVVYEKLENYKLAYFYYNKTYNLAQDEELRIEIEQKLSNIIQKVRNINEIINMHRIAFFIKKGMDSFIDDIIKGLSDEYDTRKIIVTDFKQIDEGMQWADMCWFEWCDELIIYGSKHKLAKEKKIICRLHSYEAFTEYIYKVEWNNVDKVMFVAKHILELVNEKLNKIIYSKSVVIPNGIDINKFNFRERERGFNIAYVGYINYKKGPMLLLQFFKTLYDKDNRYKLYIAGQFQDERDILYFNQMIKEWNLENAIIFDGWQNDIDKWLEDKNYIVCCSILESQNMSIMEAMAKGIKPVIHNFVGAKDIYPSELIWKTIDEGIDMITSNNYNSQLYRKFVENKFSLEKQFYDIKKIITDKDCNIYYNKTNNLEESKKNNIRLYL